MKYCKIVFILKIYFIILEKENISASRGRIPVSVNAVTINQNDLATGNDQDSESRLTLSQSFQGIRIG